jgi:hypothetical protein
MDTFFFGVVVRFFAAPHSDVASILASIRAGGPKVGASGWEKIIVNNFIYKKM